MRRIAMIGLLAAAGVACAQHGAPEQMNPTMTENDTGLAMKTNGNEQAVAEAALGIASEYLRVSQEALEVISVQAVDWPDSSLGCPQPGRSYLQVITPGHKALVRHGERVVPVHMAKASGFVCEPESGQAGPMELKPRILRLPPEQLEELARADLAQRLSVPRNDIRVLSRQAVEWQDTSLGCPEKGQDYQQKPTRGFVIRLAHKGEEYRYHSDQLRVFPCPAVASE